MKLRIHLEDGIPHLAVLVPLEEILSAISGSPGSIMSYVAPTIREAVRNMAMNAFGIDIGDSRKKRRKK